MDLRIATVEDTLTRLISGAEVTIQKPPKHTSRSFLHESTRGGVSFGLVSGKPDFVFVLALQGAGGGKSR